MELVAVLVQSYLNPVLITIGALNKWYDKAIIKGMEIVCTMS